MTAPAVPSGLPRNPVFGFAWALAWLLASAISLVGLLVEISLVQAGGEFHPKSTSFMGVLTFFFLAFGVFALVRAVLAVSPWRRYLASTSGAQRRGARDAGLREEVIRAPLTVGIVGALVWFALLAVFLVFLPQVARTDTGLVLALELLLLAAMVWVSALVLGLRRLAARRRAPYMAAPASL